jgi:Domain of unknown function (DUF4279)
VTRGLGLTPDVAGDKGQVQSPRINPQTGGPHVARTGVWYVSSEDALRTTSLERHLLWLLERIEPVADVLAQLRAEQQLNAEFIALWESATNDGGPVLSPQTLARIAALDAELGIDFWYPRPGDSEPLP